MLTIKRTCSNRIITRALNAEGEPLLALLLPGAEDCEVCSDARQLQARLEAEPAAIIVYNQHADAIALVDGLEVAPTQIFIEIRQDTRGVLGLQAYRKQGHALEPLELFHE
jgi:hypothetical protein